MNIGEKYLLIGELIDVVEDFITGDTGLADSAAPVIDSRKVSDEENWHYHFSEEDYDLLAEAFFKALDPVSRFTNVVEKFVAGDSELGKSIARVINTEENEEDWNYHFSRGDYEYLAGEFAGVMERNSGGLD